MTAAARQAVDPDGHPIRTVLSEYARPYARYFVLGTILGLLARIPGRAPSSVIPPS